MAIGRIAIVGAGNIASVHLRYLIKHYMISDIAVCDANEYQLAYFCDQAGITHRYLSLDEMLHQFQPDVVHVCTAPSSHYQIALECLQSGSHVFIEKPFVLSYDHARELVRSSEQNERRIVVGHMRLLARPYVRLKEIMETGRLGALVSINAIESYNFVAASEQGLPRWMSELPGSIVYDLLPHPLSLLLDLIPGLDCRRATVIDALKENSQFSIRLSESGPAVSIDYFLNTDFVSNELLLRFEHALVRINFTTNSLSVESESRLPGVLGSLSQSISTAFDLLVSQTVNLALFFAGRNDSYNSLHCLIERSHRYMCGSETLEPVSLEGACEVVRIQSSLLKLPQHQDRLPVELPTTRVEVAVTGAAGYIGRFLVDTLVELGYSVRILVRDRQAVDTDWTTNSNIQIVEGDLINRQLIREFCKNTDSIIHLAAASNGDIRTHINDTVVGTANLLEAVEQAGCRQLVYMSSISVLDQTRYPRGTAIDETYARESNPEKRGPYTYGKSKAEELVVRAVSSGATRVTVLRPGLVYGFGREMVSQLALRAGNWLIVFGSGRRQVPLVHVSSLVDAIVKSLESKEWAIFNIVDADAPTVRKLIESNEESADLKVVYVPRWILLTLAKVADPLLNFWFKKEMNLFYRFKASTNWTKFDTSKAEQALNWSPQATLVDRDIQ
ncbi:MAG: NAD-dependent epimerase/dehydratase family protein [Pseudomonadales bacterium]|nr:NAD-dependent epimerase/dehydratase family protein [Pseudomonadales bacterium]MBO7004800.1 NAD-dependent epimerase/dehydratase family protein [Pseudomonadales bacterium]